LNWSWSYSLYRLNFWWWWRWLYSMSTLCCAIIQINLCNILWCVF